MNNFVYDIPTRVYFGEIGIDDKNFALMAKKACGGSTLPAFKPLNQQDTLRECYAKVFEYAVKEGKTQSIMTSYNRVNGIPSSVNDMLLTTLLREEWGFDGFVVFDCGAVADCYYNPMFSTMTPLSHYYCKNMEEASAMSLTAGTDMSCGAEHKKALMHALEQGLISEDIIDRAIIRSLVTRFRLGLFDDPDKVPYSKLGAESVANSTMAGLSVDMANDTIVLLKNDKKLLPINSKSIKTVLVIGPNALYHQLGAIVPVIFPLWILWLTL